MISIPFEILRHAKRTEAMKNSDNLPRIKRNVEHIAPSTVPQHATAKDLILQECNPPWMTENSNSRANVKTTRISLKSYTGTAKQITANLVPIVRMQGRSIDTGKLHRRKHF